jgi:DNA repair protein RAD7
VATGSAQDDEKPSGKTASGGKPRAKGGKRFKRRRLGVGPEDTGDDDLTQSYHSPIKRMPGQIDNCVECGVRFTVTPYSKAAPEGLYEAGGLFCAKCANAVLGPKKPTNRNRERRRQAQSNLLDGRSQRGAKSLLQLCIEVSPRIFLS